MPRTSARSRLRTLSPARLAAALAVAALAFSLAACGDSENYIDQEELESSVLDLAPAEAQAESASCPEEVSSDAGTEFECTVTAAGEEVVVGGKVISESDEDVQFEIVTVDGRPYSP